MVEAGEVSRGLAVQRLMQPLRSHLLNGEHFPTHRPLLAHYTSMATLETILRSGEIWFSSPFYMNDFEEVRFGIQNAVTIVGNHSGLFESFSSESHKKLFAECFRKCHDQFTIQHSEELYIFCLSKHDSFDDDGLLSMWRGYGGNGTGAALVFDTGKLNANADSPLIIGAVRYASSEQRRTWITQKVEITAKILKENPLLPADMFYVAYHLYEQIKIFSLFTKHSGFREEREWRVAYMPDRDPDRRLDGHHTYSVGPSGIQPKFRFPISPIPGLTDDDLSFEKIIDRVLLGPNVSSPLAAIAAKRMLIAAGYPALAARVRSSSIPYR